MSRIEIKKEKDRYRLNLFHSNEKRRREKTIYWNVIDRDAKKLSQILIDLYLEGFPIIEAYKLMSERIKTKDWLGI